MIYGALYVMMAATDTFATDDIFSLSLPLLPLFSSCYALRHYDITPLLMLPYDIITAVIADMRHCLLLLFHYATLR